MSLVENLINQISTKELGGITKPTGFDMDDDTFAKLLEKQMDNSTTVSLDNSLGNMGMPAGFMIEPFEGVDFSETAQDQMEIIGENKLSKEEYINQPIEFKDIDMGDYFSNLIKSSSQAENNSFMNFAKRHATNAYGVFGRNFVDDMKDFVQDIASAI